jgi:hypothetical protein
LSRLQPGLGTCRARGRQLVAGVVAGALVELDVREDEVLGAVLDELDEVDGALVVDGLVLVDGVDEELVAFEVLVDGSARLRVTDRLTSWPVTFFTVSVNVCLGAEQANGTGLPDVDVGTPFGFSGALEASSPWMSSPIQALAPPVLLQTNGMSTDPFSDEHCTAPPSGTVGDPNAVIVGTAAVLAAEVLDDRVVVGGVLFELGELRVVARDDPVDRAEEVGAAPVDAAGPVAVGLSFALRATR